MDPGPSPPLPAAGDVEAAAAGDVDAAVALAAALVAAGRRYEARSPWRERRRRRRFASLVRDVDAKDFTMALSDEVVRIADSVRAARRFGELCAAVPTAFPALDRALLRLGGRLAERLPRVVMPLVTWRLRREASAVILDASDPAFARHVAHRRDEGIDANVNVLGEAILGEGEAQHRLDLVLARLARPDVDYVSVKISAICAHVDALAFDATVDAVAARLRRLYAAAMAHDPPKFVNLDMEEYRDLALTTTVFMRVLDEPAFAALDAGIVVQAYLPDSGAAVVELCEWAARRHATAGGSIKVRLVKGANLAMEHVEAELRGWPLAPYATKHEVDANYKRLLDVLLDERYDGAVRIGLASHNLFDVAWGLVRGKQLAARGAGHRLEIEMLEGMAAGQSVAVRDLAGQMLLYMPVVARDDFPAAIAYLVRRLDENTAPENFLTSLFDIEPGNEVFEREASKFRDAVAARHTVGVATHRTQDRRQPPAEVGVEAPFANEADTDVTTRANRVWIRDALAAWRPPERPVPVVVDGHEIDAPPSVADVALVTSPLGRYSVAQADLALVDRAVEVAGRAQRSWGALVEARARLVDRVGAVAARHRGQTLATMAHDAGKTIGEGDPEVSEAIDFAHYYARSIVESVAGAPSASVLPLGTVVVAPPWNFPYAIAMGGVLAALAAGNTVILKPPPQTPLTAWLVARHCWEAGIPGDVLQFVPCPDDEVGRRLVTHPDVDAVILTGAHATARMFLDWKPSMRLHAETSGKNAMVITATADIDAAIKDLVKSAFGHAGQKCSAASLAIVEATLYDSSGFLARLHDAVRSLRVGPGFELTTDVGPLVDPPAGALRRALTTLEPGESWLVEPRCLGDERLWSPGVRIAVQPGSWFARTECFGPVLGIVRAADLDEAIAIQNSTDYGLTAGLHALDPSEIERWIDRVEAGNAYVNRGTTGAIVRRQPFGGWKHSAVGATVKAGGPNYVASLACWIDDGTVGVDAAFADYRRWAAVEIDAGTDRSGLDAESNVLRARRLPRGVALRCAPEATARQIELARAAAEAAGTRLVISLADDEDDATFAARLATLHVDRLRVIGTTTDEVRRTAHEASIPIDEAEPVAAASIEMPRWTREQSVARTMHRHGHLRAPRDRLVPSIRPPGGGS
jgi:RHH-type proline utilization regulon transcriptional repressor/proline dehydrogenase/delta 1-pyrroline-5-carboxylate dehydrogenase